MFALTAKVVELDPRWLPTEQLANCEADVSLGQFDDAIADCERVASEDPHWMVHIALAIAYGNKGQLDKVAAARDKATARQPKRTIETLRASRKIKADAPAQWERFEKYWMPALRAAVVLEK